MTISSTARKAGPFSGTGAQNAFPFNFKVFAASDVLVVQTDASGVEYPLTLTAQYAVVLNSDQERNPGGTVTLPASLPVSNTLTISSAVPATQGSSIPNMGGFYPKVVEQALDKLTVITQQVLGTVGRGLRFPLSDSSPNGVLPTATVRAGRFLAFDASGSPTVASGTGADAALRTDLASSASGSALVSFIDASLGASKQTVQAILRALRVTPQRFGAAGDGVTDDTAAFQAMFATGRPWYIPYTQNGYLFSDTLTIAADGHCDSFLLAAAGFAKTAITFSDPGYGTTRIVRGLEVRPTSARQAGSIGFQIDYPDIILDRCKASVFDVGVQVRTYGTMLLNCVFQLCKTNLSAYAPSSSKEINDFKIIGGNYDSATEYAARFGDPRFSSTVADGNPHGVGILVDGANFDGAVVTIDRVFAFHMTNTYHEGVGSGNAIEIGGSGNNNCRNIVIGPACYFSRFDYAIVGNSAVQGLSVEPNHYAVTYCAVYAVNCDVSGLVYRKGSANGFAGPEVHTGFTWTTASALSFSDVTIESDYLFKGVQHAPSKTAINNWYGNAKTMDGWTQYAGTTGRFHSTAYSGIAGTQSGSNFTCTTKADALKFNGGDRVSGANGSTFVRSVDYVNGVVVVDSTGSGATTLSHAGAATFVGQLLRGFGSPEGVVTAPPGSTYVDMGGGLLYVKQSGTGNTGWISK